MTSIDKRIEFTQERINIIEKLEGQNVDSRLKGFLQFRLHNLLMAKIVQLQREKSLNEENMNKIASQLATSLKESARILHQDHGCPKELIKNIATISKLK